MELPRQNASGCLRPELPEHTTGTAQNPLLIERRVLRRLGVDDNHLDAALSQALANRTTIEQELLSSGRITPENYYARMADYLGMPFQPVLDTDCIVDRPYIDRLLRAPRGLRLEEKSGQSRFAIVPRAEDLPNLLKRLSMRPEIRWCVAVTIPSAVREAVWETGEKRRLKATIDRLFAWEPRFSARIVFWGLQGFLIGGALGALVTGLLMWPSFTFAAVHILMSSFYLLAVLIRLFSLKNGPVPEVGTDLPSDRDMPTYTIMVALYKEANMIEQLTGNLMQLNWPASKLDIKLVCEADDEETVGAILATRLPPHFELVAVPPAHPRTKPKALSYALTGARGKYLTIYDAEDRPHPDQLREAWQTFETSPRRLACLQAPLAIANIGHNWITALFACEYAGLFRGILPFLAQHHFPMPLGGTSNHFRTDILRKSRAWDPYNVAEDADLGLRLHRLGYYCGVLTLPTEEEAPTAIRPWIAQRSRWMKGWLQTAMVALREPGKLQSELGTAGFLVFLLNGLGMLVSAALHPLLFLALGMTIAFVINPQYQPSPLHQALSGIDLANILISYWVFLRLGLSRMNDTEARAMRADGYLIPFYWLMLSWSAWKAFYELYRAPFLWRKTAHKPTGIQGKQT